MRLALFLFAVCAFAQGTIDDYKRASGLRAKFQPLMEGSAGPIRWIGKTNRFWYSRTTSEGNEFVTVDTAGGRAPAFDHARLAKALTKSQGRPFHAKRLQLANLDVQEKSVEFMLGDESWSVDLATYELKKVRERPFFGRGPRVPEMARPVPSPDGKHEVLIATTTFGFVKKARRRRRFRPMARRATTTRYRSRLGRPMERRSRRFACGRGSGA